MVKRIDLESRGVRCTVNVFELRCFEFRGGLARAELMSRAGGGGTETVLMKRGMRWWIGRQNPG